MKRLSILIIIIILLSGISYGDSFDNSVISLGEDLTIKEEKEILNFFNAKDHIRIVRVSNDEEKKYLGKYIDNSLIGTKSISCAYVKVLRAGEGMNIETYNISWITEGMYRNALITAGVKNAKVKIAAPVSVSGTAALTGIIKGFENITNKNISEERKEIANEEIAKTGTLAKDIGKEKSMKLIREVKEEVIENRVKEEKDIKEIIIKISGNLNIKLADEQIDEIAELMKGISKLNLDLNNIKKQINEISDGIDNISENKKDEESFFTKIINFIKSIFEGILTWIGNILG
ncbi:DUF1002 domain-containing protein [Dethiothermospora halolimnae]|uniref:DUF1002 domain-containing protein n=1 Tax=Dethiothermospora halolimnae TaxID=3114390 RepID=UPI003CCBED43